MPPPGSATSSSLNWQQQSLIEFAVKAAETFVSAYYAASDAPRRGELLPTLYVPDSTIVWNGNAFQGSHALAQFLSQMPASKHEVQAFDCHPVGGGVSTAGGFSLPALLLTVSGVVTHHTPSSITTIPETNAPRSSSAAGTNKKNRRAGGANEFADLPIDSLPHAFSQNFVLTSTTQADGGGVNVSVPLAPAASTHGANTSSGALPPPPDPFVLAGQLFVQADSFRFVG